MSRHFVVTATDTGVGKTMFSAGLTAALGATYWKPIQSGLDEETDSQVVARLTSAAILPEAYRLTLPASPHLAAETDRLEIDTDRLVPPRIDGPLVVEGAGGVLVPVTRHLLFADLFARWALPVIVCARTGLGTINHSLLSLEALKARAVAVHGIAFVGDAMPDSEAIIPALSGIRRLGRLPMIEHVTPETLAAAFTAGFDIADFG